MTLTGSSSRADGLHRRDHDRGAGHVALHVLHRGARLEAEAARVEGHALADQGQRGRIAAAAIVEDDESRRLVRAGGHAEQPAEPLLADPGLVPDLDREPGVVGDQSDPFGQLGRRSSRPGAC